MNWSAIAKSKYPWCLLCLMIIGLLRLQILKKSACLLFIDQTTRRYFILWKQIIQIIWTSKEIFKFKINLVCIHVLSGIISFLLFLKWVSWGCIEFMIYQQCNLKIGKKGKQEIFLNRYWKWLSGSQTNKKISKLLSCYWKKSITPTWIRRGHSKQGLATMLIRIWF